MSNVTHFPIYIHPWCNPAQSTFYDKHLLIGPSGFHWLLVPENPLPNLPFSAIETCDAQNFKGWPIGFTFRALWWWVKGRSGLSLYTSAQNTNKEFAHTVCVHHVQICVLMLPEQPRNRGNYLRSSQSQRLLLLRMMKAKVLNCNTKTSTAIKNYW